MSRTPAFAALFAVLLTPAAGMGDPSPDRPVVLEQALDDLDDARGREAGGAKGGPACNVLSTVDSPRRGGARAFRHWVARCGERSELAMSRTRIGDTHWYGWSLYLPPDFQPGRSEVIVMQLAAWPTRRNGRFPCKGNGHKLVITAEGDLRFDLQHPTSGKDMVCDQLPVAQAARGRWIDFVMQARWTGDADGFLRVWTRAGDAPFRKAVEYTGATWWNDEDTGPYFKMGLYMGEPGWSGPPERWLLTDEYRMGDASAGFAGVAPRRSRLSSVREGGAAKR